MGQSWSAPGPDLLSYGFLKLVPECAADMCVTLWSRMVTNPDTLPDWLHASWLVIVPKDHRPVPGRMRPIALKNTL